MICQQGGRLFVMLSSEGIDPVTLKAPRGVAASSHHPLVSILAAVAAVVVQCGAPWWATTAAASLRVGGDAGGAAQSLVWEACSHMKEKKKDTSESPHAPVAPWWHHAAATE